MNVPSHEGYTSLICFKGGYQMTGLNVQPPPPPLPPSRAHLRGFPLPSSRVSRANAHCARAPCYRLLLQLQSVAERASSWRDAHCVVTAICGGWERRNVTQRRSFEFRRFCLIGDLGLTMRSGGGVGGGGGGDSTKATMQSLFKGKPILPASVPSSRWDFL